MTRIDFRRKSRQLKSGLRLGYISVCLAVTTAVLFMVDLDATELLALHFSEEACAGHLSAGLPTMKEHDENLQSCAFRRLEEYSNAWMSLHQETMKKYKWVKDPLHWWSRTFEYSFHTAHVTKELSRLWKRTSLRKEPIQVLDAGAGTDFISWYFLEYASNHNRPISLTAADYDYKNGLHHAEINARYAKMGRPELQTQFVQTSLQSMPMFPSSSFDIAFCVSVLEHTDQHSEIVQELARIMKPGGLLVLTFDINLIDAGSVPPARALELLNLLQASFHPEEKTIDYWTNVALEDFVRQARAQEIIISGTVQKQMGIEKWQKIHGRWFHDDLTFFSGVWRKPLTPN